MTNVTFDLETLGNNSKSPIIQIGAVKFLDDGTIIDKFLNTIKLESLSKYDFQIDYETINWWFNQSNEAIKSVFDDSLEKVNIKEGLYNFQEWLGKASEYRYWSHATFDPPILNYNFKAVNMKTPIPFRLHCDIRTLISLAGKEEFKREGIHHNALDDCIFQANYISKYLKKINK